jgi:hypothetical protein
VADVLVGVADFLVDWQFFKTIRPRRSDASNVAGACG